MTRRSFLIALAVLAVPLTVVSGASADCAAPQLSVEPAQVSVGGEIEVTGQGWSDVCNDTVQSIGCWDAPQEENRPAQNIELHLMNRDTKERYPLGVVDANEEFSFTFTSAIDVPPGWYVVKDARGESYPSLNSRFRVIGR